MDRTDSIFDEDYCSKNKNKSWRYDVVPEIVRILCAHFDPKSVIDFGCANGLHVASFKKHGVCTFGVEGTIHYCEYIEENYDGPYMIIDLRLPFDLRDRYELAICIEVLEHIDKDFEMIAIENICRHAEVLCITASSRRSRKHINVENKEYWVDRFEKFRDFKFREKETRKLQDKFKKMEKAYWLREDLMIFRRK